MELWIDAVVSPGSEETSGRLEDAGRRVADAFDRAQDAIVAIGAHLAGSVKELNARGAYPSQVELEFGFKFTTTGGLVVVEASADASLAVRITYDRHNVDGGAVDMAPSGDVTTRPSPPTGP